MAILTATNYSVPGGGCIQVNKSLEEVRKILKEAVKDGDGGLDKKELKQAFKQLGSHLPALRVRRPLHQADADEDGLIAGHELNELTKYAVSKYGHKMAN